MPYSTIEDLFTYYTEKVKHRSILEQRKLNLMNNIDRINQKIEEAEAQINTIKVEMTSHFNSLVPKIEVTCFGLDERRRKIWGGIVTFPSIDIKFYKILHEFDYFFEDPDVKPVEFNNRIREAVLTWLHNEPDLSLYTDIGKEQKRIIQLCIRNIDLQNANYSVF